jgi:hypothetical protein
MFLGKLLMLFFGTNLVLRDEYLTFKADVDLRLPVVKQSHYGLPKLEKLFSAMSLNSAVNAIAIRKRPGSDYRVLLGGCTVNAIAYNGPELLAVSRCKTSNKYSALLLDGHKTFHRRRKISNILGDILTLS